MALSAAPVVEAVLTAESLARRMMLPLLALLAVLAVLDLAWVRHRHEKKLRMSRQEVRDELIQRDGNPHVRGRLRAAARELSRHRLVAEVARADVVIRNPTHFAVALAYRRSEMAAPTVVAMGRNRAALRILDIARSAEVPIVENPPLARLLYRTGRLGREVPQDLYQAVAEVLGHVYQLDRRRGNAWGVS
jgi:flagellar biosynthetic protein FlhB